MAAKQTNNVIERRKKNPNKQKSTNVDFLLEGRWVYVPEMGRKDDVHFK